VSFIFKCVIILIVFSFIVYVMKTLTRVSVHLRRTVKDVKNLREKVSGQPAADMVRCLACGAFVSSQDALTISGKGRAQSFCSHDCLAKHAQRA
jgi:hypothetical protein